MASSSIKLACALVMCMMVAAPLAEAAVTCGLVTANVAPCIAYLRGGAGPSPACCSGIKSLNSAAATTADRQTACACLKTAANSIPGLNYAAAAKLPGQCGVNVPYPISQSTNCNAVH